MNEDRKKIDQALKEHVVPTLRSAGFKGSMPHFRRASAVGIDVMTFQFDRYGGGFVIELAQCSREGFLTSWGKEILPNKVTTWDLPSSWRHRIKPREGGGLDSWFRFENGRSLAAASEVIDQLPNVEAWFQSGAQTLAPTDRPKAAPSGVR